MTASPLVADFSWPASLPREVGLAAAAELEAAGAQITCRVQPVRRGAEVSAAVLLTGSMMTPFLTTIFERLAGDAYTGFTRWFQGLRNADGTASGVTSVVFENQTTGADFVFTDGLPVEAFRAAIELAPGAEPGRWVWDTAANTWVRFEPGRRRRTEGKR